MKLTHIFGGLAFAISLTLSCNLFSATAAQPDKTKPTTPAPTFAAAINGIPQEGTAAANIPTQEQAQSKLQGLNDIKTLIMGIKNIGNILLTLFSFGDMASGINKTTGPLFAIIDEFNKETPDINNIIKNIQAMQEAQSLIIKDVERMVKVLVFPLNIFSPLVIKSLEKQGKVKVVNGTKMVEMKKCVTKTTTQEITQNGKKFNVPQQTIETVTSLVPAKEATKYIVDFTVCQVFKLLNSYQQLITTLLGYYTKFSGIVEKKEPTKQTTGTTPLAR